MKGLLSDIMKDGICSRCNGREVYIDENPVVANGIKIGFWHSAVFDRYVCTDCGYVESYISDESKLKLIREKWVKVKVVE